MRGARQLAASVPIRTATSGAQIGIPILVVQTTGDVALGALLVSLALLPSIVAAPLVGALLDATQRPRRLMVASATGLAGAYGLASALGPVPVGVVATVLVLSGLLIPFGFGGFSSFVAMPGQDARRAYALDALSYNFSGVTGPAIIAVLVPTVGPRAALASMAVIALTSALAYRLLPMQPRNAQHSSLRRSMSAGIGALAAIRQLRVLTIVGTITEFGRGILPIAAIGVALAVTGDAAASATIIAAFAVGALIGTMIVTLRKSTLPPHVTMIIGFALTGLATVAAALGSGLTWTVILIGLSGLFTAAPTAALLLLRRTQSPDDVVAQVFTVSAALRVAGAAAGTALAGAIAGVGPAVLLALSAGVWLIGALLMLGYAERRRRPGAGPGPDPD